MIPTRDGVRLHTRIFIPKNQDGPLPFILLRTPYGTKNAADNFVTYLKDLADDGYIFAFQDLRGKFESEGVFVMQRPAAPGRRVRPGRRDRHLRHHRMAAQERAEEQWTGRDARRLLPRLDHDHGRP